MYEIGVIRRFSAAHRLRDYNGKCENLHGHNYKVELTVHGDNLTNGMLIDFVLLKQKLDAIIKNLDHSYINEIDPFTKIEPSAENIAEYIYNALSVQISDKVYLSSVKVWESDDNWALYRTDK
jgi:6-pyruvoyltetrahydropterin/6-carboxytetrahydropterin synthase